MSLTLQDLMRGVGVAADIMIPEEMFGFDITPGYGPGQKGERRQYKVYRDKGRLIDVQTRRTIGYTPQAAKKKYKVKRRRRRWTQRDEKEMQWKAYIATIMAGRPGVPP